MSNIVNNCCVNIVDIGASGGIHPRFKKVINNLKAVLFEPDPREFNRLKNSIPHNYVVLNTALSDIPGEVVFSLCKKQEVSSIFMPNNIFLNNYPEIDRFTITEKVKMLTDTLDNQLEKNGIKEIDFIKIDTEGADFLILKGAKNTISNILGLEVEVCFAPIRKNQPLFHDIDKYMSDLNFQLLDIRRYYWKRRKNQFRNSNKGQIILGEALYFRSPEFVCDLPQVDERKIIAHFLLLLAYGYLDIAENLYIISKEKNILSKDTIIEMRSMLEKCRGRLIIPDFKGKQRIHNILTKIANIFCSNSWAACDPELGN